jgi:hypothetical protein
MNATEINIRPGIIIAIAIEPVSWAVHAMIVFTINVRIALVTPICPTTTALG